MVYGENSKEHYFAVIFRKKCLWEQGYYARRARVRIDGVLRSKRLGSEWKACKGQKKRRARVRFKGVFHKGVWGLETANVTFLHYLHFTFLHGGLLRGPEAGLEMAYFFQKLDSRWLILHFYIFTFLHGGLLRGPEAGLEMTYFVQKLDSRRLIYIFKFLHFYIFTWGSAQGSRSWARDGLFCSKTGLHTANFTF